MPDKRIVSEGAAKILSSGIERFLWYLASTTEAPTREFHLEPGFKVQNIVHLQNSGGPDRAYDITIGRDENPVFANVVIRQDGGTLKMNTLMATLQLVNEICMVAVSLSDDQLKRLSWTSFVASVKAEQNPELVQYLKERRIFINEPAEMEEDA